LISDSNKPIIPNKPVSPVDPDMIKPDGKLLGPSSGKFFMVSLNMKPTFGGRVYYADMQIGTQDLKSKVTYSELNKPLNITY